MGNLRKIYRDLEMRVFHLLRSKIENSNVYSSHTNEKCIKINLDNYTEIGIINGKLTFMDGNGHQYSIFNSNLEDLINIVENGDKFKNWKDDIHEVKKISKTGLIIYAKNINTGILHKFRYYQSSGEYIIENTANTNLGYQI